MKSIFKIFFFTLLICAVAKSMASENNDPRYNGSFVTERKKPSRKIDGSYVSIRGTKKSLKQLENEEKQIDAILTTTATTATIDQFPKKLQKEFTSPSKRAMDQWAQKGSPRREQLPTKPKVASKLAITTKKQG